DTDPSAMLGRATPMAVTGGGTARAGAAVPHARPAPAETPRLDAAAHAPTPTMRTCPSCGNQVPLEFVFCGQCGQRLGAEAAPKPNPKTLFLNQPGPSQPQVR